MNNKQNSPSIVHFAGGGSLRDTLSIYALILSRCFSQKCCTVSLIGYGSNTLILWLEFDVLLELPLFELLIIVTLVLFARRDVTVTGPEIEIGFVGLTDNGPEPGWLFGVTTDTVPNAVLECWMDTADVIGVKASDDLPDVSGLTDIDCVATGGPEIIAWPAFWNKYLDDTASAHNSDGTLTCDNTSTITKTMNMNF